MGLVPAVRVRIADPVLLRCVLRNPSRTPSDAR